MLVWDATCPDTLAPSHITLAARECDAVAADAEHRKRLKYTHLERSHYFVPVAIETIGAHGPEAKLFFRELARRVASVNNEPLSHQFLVQRLAVAIQRGNASAVLGSLRVWDKHECLIGDFLVVVFVYLYLFLFVLHCLFSVLYSISIICIVFCSSFLLYSRLYFLLLLFFLFFFIFVL